MLPKIGRRSCGPGPLFRLFSVDATGAFFKLAVVLFSVLAALPLVAMFLVTACLDSLAASFTPAISSIWPDHSLLLLLSAARRSKLPAAFFKLELEQRVYFNWLGAQGPYYLS